MAVDTAVYVNQFDLAKPTGGDPKSEGDDNFRHIKTVLKATFPNVSGAVTATHTQMSYVTGVTSSIQPQIDAKAPTFNAVLTGDPKAPTPAPGDSDTSIATTAFVATSFAPLASPTFTGVPIAPTATTGTSTNQIATTAFVTATAFAGALPAQAGNSGKYITTDGTNASWGSLSAYATTAAVASTYAPIASPTLTGTPAAPTAAAGTNTTQIATTEFATRAVGGYAADAIGTYVFAKQTVGGITHGATVAGSNLTPAEGVAGGTYSDNATNLAGTWRAMGYGNGAGNYSLYLRIA